MDSRVWLAASALVAAALAALLVADLAARPDAAPARRVVPEWSAAAVRAIRVERAGQPLVLERSAAAGVTGEGWTIRLPAGASVPADPAAVRDLLGTIEMLAPIRRDPGRIDTARLTLIIERDAGPPIRLLVAAAGPGATDRVWLARAGTGGRFLVDGYAARALDPATDSLRERRPLRGRVDGATRIQVGGAVLSGAPWKIQLPAGAARAAPDRVEDLLAAASRLRIDRFVEEPGDAAQGDPPPLHLVIDARAGRSEIVDRGPCTGGARLVDTPIGRGCLAVPDSLLALATRPEEWVDRDLVGAPIDSIGRLRLAQGSRSIAVERADSPEVLRDWLARWRAAAAGPVVPASATPATPVATVELDLDGGGHQRITIVRAQGRLAASRDDEPVALLLHSWAAEHLEPAPHRFRSLDLLPYEPTALRAATARRSRVTLESIERGDTLEEWRAVAPPDSQPRPAALESLRQAVGFLRAERFESARARPADGLSPPRRIVDLVFDPAPGESDPLRHTIEIGAASAAGCHARLDRDPAVFALGAERCAALLGPWTDRR